MTDDDQCETYGHDLMTGAAVTATDPAALRFDGRARLKGAEWTPPPETPDDSYPMYLMTAGPSTTSTLELRLGGRTSSTPRAPESWVELASSDAAELGINEGDLVRVESRRGSVELAVRCNGNRPSTVFLPFHYGDLETAAND
jgi:ferredoxin-nitrate reductase